MAYQQGYRPQTRSQRSSANGGGRARSSAPPRKKTRKRKRGRPFRLFLTLVLLAFIATAGVMAYMMYEEVAEVERLGTFYQGVYVDGVHLYGATPEEAYRYLVNRAREGISDWHVTLRYGDAYWEITPDTLGMNWAIESVIQEEVNKAFLIGRENTSLLERYQVVTELKSNPYLGYSSGLEKNTAQVEAMIADIQTKVNTPAVDATWAFDKDRRNPIVITAEQYGQELDVEALKAQINNLVTNMEAGTIQIETKPIAPNVLAADLQNKVVLIGSMSTEIARRSTEERNKNIERGLQAFHGKIVQPDERVSFNSWVGTRTKDNGFFDAQEIVSGEYTWGVGGGICQVSSTLYNAVIHANLRVRERQNHGIPVNYLPMGADATVSDGRKDFVFQNNTGEPIYLIARMETSGSTKTCVVQIYGRPDPNGYSYSLEHETIEEIPIPEPEYIKDRKQEHVIYTDQTYEESKGSVGYKVRTYLVIKDPRGGTVSREPLYVDTYSAQKPKIWVGTTPR